MTGIEAAIITRRRLPKCKILLFSGDAATADLLGTTRSHGHEFELLTKTVHPTDLLAKYDLQLSAIRNSASNFLSCEMWELDWRRQNHT